MDLDDRIRDGLRVVTNDVDVPDPHVLAERLTERRSDVVARRVRWRGMAVAAAIVAVAVAAGGLVVATRGTDEQQVVTTPTPDRSAWSTWTPGWHELDPGPVPPMAGVSLTWFQDRLVIAGTTDESDGTATGAAFEFDPAERSWNRIPPAPFLQLTVVAADEHLVAVGSLVHPSSPTAPQAYGWATWRRGDEAWTMRGGLPVAPELVAAGALGPQRPNGTAQLVWTGERVVDVTHGAVLDPASSAARELSMPSDVVAYTHLLSATPVWTGTEVLLAAWSTGPGLAWSAEGERLEDVPGVPRDEAPAGMDTRTVATGGDVVLLASGPTSLVGHVARLDARRREWTVLENAPRLSGGICSFVAVSVGHTPVALPCPDGPGDVSPQRLIGDQWSPIAGHPILPDCCLGAALGTEDAMIVWASDTDTLNNPEAPYRRAAVWIPTPPEDADRPAGPEQPPLLVTTTDGSTGVWDGREFETQTVTTGASQVVPTPDGEHAIVSWQQLGTGCDGARPLDEVSLRESPSTLRRIGPSADLPMVSPDGTWVAYRYRCDGSGVGVTNLETLDRWRIPEGSEGQPLAWLDERTLLIGVDHVVREAQWSGSVWTVGDPRDDLPSPPVATSWLAAGDELVFAVGSRLQHSIGGTDELVRDLGRDGGQQILAISAVRPGELSELVVTAQEPDGTIVAWHVRLRPDAEPTLTPLALPGDAAQVVAVPRR